MHKNAYCTNLKLLGAEIKARTQVTKSNRISRALKDMILTIQN